MLSLLRSFLLSAIGTVGLTLSAAAQPTSTRTPFEENKGQWPAAVRYRAAFGAGTLYLRAGGFVYDWYNATDLAAARTALSEGPAGRPPTAPHVRGHAVFVDFVGARAAGLEPESSAPAYSNYFVGAVRAAHVRSYAAVTYRQVWPGIDVQAYTNPAGQFEYDLLIAPGADPTAARLRYRGAAGLALTPEGALRIRTTVGEVLEQRPVAYQPGPAGTRTVVTCRYELRGTELAVALPNGYDRTRPLVIDPVVQAATFVGSAYPVTGAHTATPDAAGNIYIGGYAGGPGYPVTPGAYNVPLSGTLSISKFDPRGTTLLFSTYFGGVDGSTGALYQLAVDARGRLFAYAQVGTRDFPVTPNAYDATLNGSFDLALAKFSAAGDSLLAATYLGGTDVDSPTEFALSAQGEPCVGGYTSSANFPTTPGVLRRTYQQREGFIAQLSADLRTLRWSTFVGTPEWDGMRSVRVATNGDVYFTAYTEDETFAVDPRSAAPTYSSGFVGCLSADGRRLRYSTYIPCENIIRPRRTTDPGLLDLDLAGNVYVLGKTTGYTALTTLGGGYQGPGYINPVNNQPAVQQLFVVKFDSTLRQQLGGAVVAGGDLGNVVPLAMGVDSCGNVSLGAYTRRQAVLPVLNPLPNVAPDATMYIATVAHNFLQLGSGTYYGNPTAAGVYNGNQFRHGVDRQGRVYLNWGLRNGNAFPTTSAAYLHTNPNNIPGGTDCIAVVIDPQTLTAPTAAAQLAPPRACTGQTVDFFNNSTAFGGSLWDFGDNSPRVTTANPHHAYSRPGTYHPRLIARPSATSCHPADTLTLTVEVLPAAQRALPTTAVLCPTDSVVLDAGNPAVGTWQWNTGATTRTLTVRQPGVYTVVTGSTGCLRTDSVRVLADPAPRLVADSTACQSGTLRVEGAPAGSTYRWSTGATTAVLAVPTAALYSVEVTTPAGCRTTLQAPAGPLAPPNIITPNGDGQNESFVVTGLPANTQLTIFNRWGRRLYRQESYDQQWAGTGLAAGTYYYLLDGPGLCRAIRGWVEIVR
jgi:gliding motility-associated-like protein